MAEVLCALPSALPRARASVICNERLRSCGVASQDGRVFARGGKRATGSDRKSGLTSPVFWGVQVVSHPSFDSQTTARSKRHRNAVSKNQASGTVFAYSDPELQSVLELASDAELLDLSNILYGRSLLSPLLKSLAPGAGAKGNGDGHLLRSQSDRDALTARLEERFLFLAADAKNILSGCRPTYRKVLKRVRQKLRVPCAADLSTTDMESEIFLHLLQQYSRKETLETSQEAAKVAPSANKKRPGRQWPIGLPAVVKLRGKELWSTVLKGGGAVGVSTLQRMVFRRLAGKLLIETARYQLAKEAVVKTGQVAATQLETRVAVLAAKQGLIGAAKHYLTLRSAMMVLGPMLWGTLLVDMLISAVGTDYARIVRAIYAIAQIRLVRNYTFDSSLQMT